MIDVAALRSLIQLETAGTVAAAAEDLGYTPSAVSQQIKRLERDLGVPLVERVGRGLVLTPQGRTAVTRARVLLDDLERLRTEVGGPALQGELRMAAFSTAERGIVAPVAARLRSEAPHLTLVVIEHDPPPAMLALERGDVELAIAHTWGGPPEHLPGQVRTALLGEDRADVIVPADHPLAGRAEVTPADLVGQTWTCVHAGSVCHQWLLQMFTGLEAPVVRYWTSEFASQVAHAEAGNAIALVPRLGRGPLPHSVTAVPVVGPTPRRPVLAAWRDSRAGDATLTHVRRALAHQARTVLDNP